jgi:hypothetical protein
MRRVAQAADRHAAFLDVGDHVHLGMVGEERPAERVRPGRIELAEVAAEREDLRVGELLVPEAQHEMLEPRGADLSENLRRDRPRGIDAGDLGADGVTKLFDVNQVPP